LPSLPAFLRRRESILVIHGAYPSWRRIGEWVCAQQAEDRAVAVQQAHQRSSSVGIQSTIVIQFSHDRLPLTMSTSWKAMVRRPPIAAKGCGVKYRNGTPSSTTCLKATPARCATEGSQWKYQLSGFGIGYEPA
jgi:hypothetical protein